MTDHESPSVPPPSSPRKAKIGIPWVPVAAGLFGLALGVAGGVFLAMNRAMPNTMQQIHAAQAALVQAQKDRVQAQMQADMLMGQLVVEESTRKSLEATLQSVQEELGQARDQLAFFDQLFPPGPSGTVSIRAMEVEPVGDALQYRVLLSRNINSAGGMFRGNMQFTAKGMQDGKPVTIPLSAARASASDDESEDVDLSVEFDRFQRSVGLLALPAGFVPQEVTLNVVEGSSVRVTRRISLPVAQ